MRGHREEPELFAEPESGDGETPSNLAAARQAAAVCTRCLLYANATQTVFGEGAARAEIMFVGEQPGDQEDLAGRPFVGPAGFSTRRWSRPASIGGGPTSPMR